MLAPIIMRNMRKAGRSSRVFVFIAILPIKEWIHFIMESWEKQESGPGRIRNLFPFVSIAMAWLSPCENQTAKRYRFL
jgi:hypothetical protein